MYEFFAYRLAGMIPLLLVWSAGGLLCLIYAQRLPRTVVLVGAAMGLQLLATIFFALFPMFGAWLLSTTDIGARVFIMSLLDSLPSAVSWGLILWAVFGEQLARQAEQRVLLDLQKKD